jgi:hypothetical protein
MIILTLPPPPGYVHLYRAVDAIGRALRGAEWVSVRCQDELKHQVDTGSAVADSVMKTVAEACEAGKLAAAFQHLFKGADDLDRSAWRKPHWRNYFSTGTTIVDQPRLIGGDERCDPDPSGQMIPCERKIFIRKDSLDCFVASLAPTVAASRYPGDVALIEEGRWMLESGMEKRAVARKLAPRAEGAGTFESKVDRLRKAL